MRKCRTLPTPARFEIPSAAEESANISPDNFMPTSSHRPIIPSTSAEAATIACNSASALLNATVFCSQLYVFMTCEPMVTIPPLVLFAVAMHPAQSESVNPVTVEFGACHLK